jgi:hypothetical protein
MRRAVLLGKVEELGWSGISTSMDRHNGFVKEAGRESNIASVFIV